jgi:YHS domain-containing protein
VSKLLVVSICIAGIVSCAREDSAPRRTETPTATVAAPAATPAPAALPAGVARVTDPSQVCMVNDQFMGRAQIPVLVEGRTYYGCCPMCKEKLEKQPGMRTARDPVSGEEVDKAKAVIVQDASGKVLYFASEDTLRRYRG